MFYQEAQQNPSRPMRQFHTEVAPYVSYTTFKRALRQRNIKKWKKLKRLMLLLKHAAVRLEWVCSNISLSILVTNNHDHKYRLDTVSTRPLKTGNASDGVMSVALKGVKANVKSGYSGD